MMATKTRNEIEWTASMTDAKRHLAAVRDKADPLAIDAAVLWAIDMKCIMRIDIRLNIWSFFPIKSGCGFITDVDWMKLAYANSVLLEAD